MRLYGLLGKTLKHSFSKSYFTKKFAEEGINDCSYDNFELSSIEELPQLLEGKPELKGFNITIPYKEVVIPFLDFKNKVVDAIGACNCVRIENNKLSGYNTDVVGFEISLKKNLQDYHNKALVLGTGGAAKAVRFVLEKLGIEYLNVSRNAQGDTISYNDINEDLINDHTLIINTTPLGMYPNMDEAPAIPYQHLTPKHYLYDLIYNPAKTKFLEEGEKQGAVISNGHEMLLLQAEESWRIWNS